MKMHAEDTNKIIKSDQSLLLNFNLRAHKYFNSNKNKSKNKFVRLKNKLNKKCTSAEISIKAYG